MTELNCIVVTPEQTVRETTADFVVVALSDGELGIGAGHAPLIGRLGYGELRIRSGSQVERFYVEGGFVEVLDNVVSLLTNRAVAAGKIDEQAASRQLEAAPDGADSTPDIKAARQLAAAQARAQLRVARRANAGQDK